MSRQEATVLIRYSNGYKCFIFMTHKCLDYHGGFSVRMSVVISGYCVSSGSVCRYLKICCVRCTHISRQPRVDRGYLEGHFLLLLNYMYSETGEQQSWYGRGAVKAQTTLYSVKYCSLIMKLYGMKYKTVHGL